MTLYAIWRAIETTLTANANGGTITSTNGWSGTGETATKYIAYGSEYGSFPNATRQGYRLVGWSRSSTQGAGTLSLYETCYNTTDSTIYAQWEEIHSFSVAAQPLVFLSIGSETTLYVDAACTTRVQIDTKYTQTTFYYYGGDCQYDYIYGRLIYSGADSSSGTTKHFFTRSYSEIDREDMEDLVDDIIELLGDGAVVVSGEDNGKTGDSKKYYFTENFNDEDIQWKLSTTNNIDEGYSIIKVRVR